MSKIKYCNNCILPNSRPNLNINESGICSGCKSTDFKQVINWKERKKLFKELVYKIKRKAKRFDCVIPVSGGKDSTWQVIKALEYGLRPLCVTWKTPVRNKIGKTNLENLIKLGVNHIDFSINPTVEKRFVKKSFETLGSPVIPMHMALHAVPLQIAVGFRIPLILWGENSAFEYGGDDKTLKGVNLNHAWLKKYGVTNGTTAKDWIDKDLTSLDLSPYHWPSDAVQRKAGVKAVFLGHFFKWDPQKTFKVAKQHGFQAGIKPKTGYYSFADIDDEFLITIHHWMKWYKFGFTRMWDNLSLEIRNKRISRQKAINIIKKFGNEFPVKEISDFCKYIEITEKRFFEIAETFRNKSIWKKYANGKYQIEGFLIENWKW